MTGAQQILHALDRLGELLASDADLDRAGQRALLERALELMLDFLDADRVFLILVSGEGDKASFGVPIERTRPAWPGARAKGVPPAVDAFNQRCIVEAQAHPGQTLCYGPGQTEIPADSDIHTVWQVQTMLLTLMRPRLGPAWFFGAHYCEAPRELGVEPELLSRLGQRLSDSVSTMTAVEQLRESEARYRTLVEHAPEAIVLVDVAHRRFVDCNHNATELLGWSVEELLELDVLQISPELQPDGQSSAALAARYLAAACAGEPQSFEWEHIAADGRSIPCEVRLVLVPGSGGPIVRGSISDISDRKALERNQAELAERLRQAQKLEALGRLTGGVAHDFNNLLTIISGQLELVELDLEDEALREDIGLAREACTRAAGLTQQLLTFARRKPLLPRALDLSAEVSTCVTMLRRTLREGVEVVLDLEPELPACELDPNQLSNTLVNLGINARDAMAGKGRLEISTEHVTLEPGARVDVDGVEIVGEFVVVHVRDDGPGIPAELLGQIFEPFVTSKGDGGTGLGLSTVYGFVKQSGGFIQVDTERGRGTCFSLHFPVVASVAEPAEDGPGAGVGVASRGAGGGQRLLVVEDQDEVRRLLVQMLESLGYRCLAASGAGQALDQLRARDDIAALISSMTLASGEQGLELARAARQLRPAISILIVSGYTQDESYAALSELGAELLEKPFTRVELEQSIARVVPGPL